MSFYATATTLLPTYTPTAIMTLTADGGIYWHGIPMHWLLVATFALQIVQLFVAVWERRGA